LRVPDTKEPARIDIVLGQRALGRRAVPRDHLDGVDVTFVEPAEREIAISGLA
jgi:hypothetical protein